MSDATLTDEQKRRQLRILRAAAAELLRKGEEMLDRATMLERLWWPEAVEVDECTA